MNISQVNYSSSGKKEIYVQFEKLKRENSKIVFFRQVKLRKDLKPEEKRNKNVFHYVPICAESQIS